MENQEVEVTTIELLEPINSTNNLTTIETILEEIKVNNDVVLQINTSILITLMLVVAVLGILIGINIGNMVKGER